MNPWGSHTHRCQHNPAIHQQTSTWNWCFLTQHLLIFDRKCLYGKDRCITTPLWFFRHLQQISTFNPQKILRYPFLIEIIEIIYNSQSEQCLVLIFIVISRCWGGITATQNSPTPHLPIYLCFSSVLVMRIITKTCNYLNYLDFI